MKKITLVFFLILSVLNSYAQSVGEYVFTQSTETYEPVVGIPIAATGDDGAQNNIPIGFNFNYAGVNYTTFSVSTNGFIRLGSPISGFAFTNVLSLNSEQRPLIAAFWDDNNNSSGAINYFLSGTAPDRIIEIGWDNVNIGGGGSQSTTAFASFKMRLFETTGVVEFIYGPTMNAAGNLTASIGLNDLTSFLSVSPNSETATSSNVTANNAINSTAFLPGQKFTFGPGSHCSGTPAPGNTISSSPSICANIPFTLSLENHVGFGATYQWQISINGGEFTNVVDAINSSFTTSQTVTTSYQCIVTCDNATTISNPVEVGVTAVNQCFCTPTYTIGKTNGDIIASVFIPGTTLDNTSGTALSNPAYTYFTGQPNYTASLQVGQAYDINLISGNAQQQNFTVWIDFNDDGIFGSNERIGNAGPIIGAQQVVISFTLGCDAAVGPHRMRIRDVRNTIASNIDPCQNYVYGETEDYEITIVDAPICFAPRQLGTTMINPTNASLTWTPACHQTGWDVHFGFAGAGLPVGNPSNPNSNYPLLLTDLTPGTNYEFYVRSVCDVDEYSEWAGPYAFTTLPPPIANDECNNAIALIPGTTFQQNAVMASNIDASKSINTLNPTCAAFNFGGDVWFSTVVPPDGKITIEVQASPGSPFVDSGMNAFIGTCDNLTVIGCSDDEGIGSFSKLNLTGLTAGQTVYARVWEYGNNVHGAFQVSAWSPTLSNNTFDQSNFKYYPNPVKDYLNISYSEIISKVIVYNMLGQEILIQNPNTMESKIDVNALPSGAYLVKVFSNDLQNTIKINKE